MNAEDILLIGEFAKLGVSIFKVMSGMVVRDLYWRWLPKGITISTEKILLGTGETIAFNSIKTQKLATEEIVQVLVKNVQGLTEEQAKYLLELMIKYKPNRIVFGGSRVRGNSTAISDLEVGFDGLKQNDVFKFANDYNKKFYGQSQYTGEGAIKDRFIISGKELGTVPKILTPEEFFMRSGLRNIKDKGGIPFSPSGFISITQDGMIQFGRP